MKSMTIFEVKLLRQGLNLFLLALVGSASPKGTLTKKWVILEEGASKQTIYQKLLKNGANYRDDSEGKAYRRAYKIYNFLRKIEDQKIENNDKLFHTELRTCHGDGSSLETWNTSLRSNGRLLSRLESVVAVKTASDFTQLPRQCIWAETVADKEDLKIKEELKN